MAKCGAKRFLPVFNLLVLLALLAAFAARPAQADVDLGQTQVESGLLAGEWYVSWGYNKDYWAPSDIHVVQPALGNDFVIHGVTAVDYPGWDEPGSIFAQGITIPQFDLRVGHFFKGSDYGFEVSLDHTKFTSNAQSVLVTGTQGGVAVNSVTDLTPSYFSYMLHNGVNHVMLNAMRRFRLLGPINRSLSAALIAKAGVGIVMPHAANTVLGVQNDVGPKALANYGGYHSGWWQFNGWTAGAEIALRVMLVRPVYIEITDKVAYANLGNVPVNAGTASQSLWMNMVALNLGVAVLDR